jgi:hypothetical protein
VESQKDSAVGLCLDCANVKVVRSDRGSIFYSCRLSATDSGFPKYPRLPVLICRGYLQKVNPNAE